MYRLEIRQIVHSPNVHDDLSSSNLHRACILSTPLLRFAVVIRDPSKVRAGANRGHSKFPASFLPSAALAAFLLVLSKHLVNLTIFM
jgi:hypothetical protein